MTYIQDGYTVEIKANVFGFVVYVTSPDDDVRRAEDESDIADVEWRYKQDAAGLLALGYGVYESAFFKAGKAHLRRVLSYIEEVKQ